MTSEEIIALAREIHAGNIAAGWWSMGIENRNRPEILMLVVSEVGEASEGALTGAMDDKLPHLPMFDVELADTAIRLLDVIGADAVEGEGALADWGTLLYSVLGEFDHVEDNPDAELMVVVRYVCRAMEGHRKERTAEYRQYLWTALAGVFEIADLHNIELADMIAQKRAFNAVRADHKPENRAKAGGKAY